LDYAEAKGLKEGEAKGLAKGMAKGMVKGMAKGKAEGEKLKTIEIAKKLKTLGIPFDQISIATKLSLKEIENIIV
jgi:predicted transposase YdaD